jgi:hypothetical protein
MHPPPLMSMFLRHEDWSNGLSIATFVKSFLSRTQGGAGPCSTAPDRRECRQSRRRDPCPDFIGMHAIRQKPMSRNRPSMLGRSHLLAVDLPYAASAPLGWARSERCAPETSPWPSAICGWQVISDSSGQSGSRTSSGTGRDVGESPLQRIDCPEEFSRCLDRSGKPVSDEA